jgi:hypothetical protein
MPGSASPNRFPLYFHGVKGPVNDRLRKSFPFSTPILISGRVRHCVKDFRSASSLASRVQAYAYRLHTASPFALPGRCGANQHDAATRWPQQCRMLPSSTCSSEDSPPFRNSTRVSPPNIDRAASPLRMFFSRGSTPHQPPQRGAVDTCLFFGQASALSEVLSSRLEEYANYMSN